MRADWGVDSRLRRHDDIGWVADMFSSLLLRPHICGRRLRYSGVYPLAELCYGPAFGGRRQRVLPARVFSNLQR